MVPITPEDANLIIHEASERISALQYQRNRAYAEGDTEHYERLELQIEIQRQKRRDAEIALAYYKAGVNGIVRSA